MRLPIVLFLAAALILPGEARAQDIPSLQRPNPALPITTSPEILRARLGKPGGAFAAAQLALIPGGWLDLFSCREDPDPLRRLDVAYGLGLVGSDAAFQALATMLGDPDPRVAGEAYHGLFLPRLNVEKQLTLEAVYGKPASADVAVYMLFLLGKEKTVRDVAATPLAGGRGAAIQHLNHAFEEDLPIFESAARDPRESVRLEAFRRIMYGSKTPARTQALNRLAASPDPRIRLSLIHSMDEDPGKSLDPAYERAASLGAVGTRREFARRVLGNLYDRRRMVEATQLLSRLLSDPSPTVGDTAVNGLYMFVADRIDGPGELPWDRLTPTVLAALRQGVGRRLSGPLSFQAAVVLAQLHDSRAFAPLVRHAFGPISPESDQAVLSLADLGDRRITRRLLDMARSGQRDALPFRALSRLHDPGSLAPLLHMVKPGANGLNAANALATIGDRSATPELLRLVKADLNVSLYAPLGALGGPGVKEFLIDQLEHAPEDVLQYVSGALGLMTDPSVVAELKRVETTYSGARSARAKEARENIAYHARTPRSRRSWW